MLSSPSARYPAFSDQPPDRRLSTSLDPDELQLFSHIRPALAAGKYKVNVEHRVVFPDQESEDTTRVLSLQRRFNVQGPKFKLLDPNDILSVHPAPGHAAPNHTLAHVVLTDPTLPWERTVEPLAGDGVFNPTPWLAVLTFTEEELLRSSEDIKSLGFGDQSQYGAFTASADKVKTASKAGTLTTALDSQTYGNDYQDTDLLDLITLEPELFHQLFADYTSGQRNWTGAPDLRRYGYMAHVREVHGGFMASTTKDNPQPQYGVVVSLRTAPAAVERETRMITHLVSLEGLDKLQPNASAKWATLISLHAWHWTCTPPDRTSFVDQMAALGSNIQPLRVADRHIEALGEPDQPDKPDDADQAASKKWLADRMKAGYTLIPHTTTTGEKAMALFRGPLCPGIPDSQGVKAWSLFGTDLQVLDAATGMFNVSYSTAWNLGRMLAVGHRTFTTSLLRLRGKIHSAAVDKAQLQHVRAPLDVINYLRNLQNSIETVVQAQNTSAVEQAKVINRWYRTAEEKAQTPARRLMAMSSCKDEDYEKQVFSVLESLSGNTQPPTGAGTVDTASASSTSPEVDSDWTTVRGWVINQLFLANIPLHYFVTDPESLPRESIRTFAIDPTWVECVIDGGLSLANHFSEDDDVIRRALKMKINEFLATPIPEGPRKGSRPQIPKWGFFLRSIAVTAFPDLKVEAPIPDHFEKGLAEVVYMQRLSDDIIICLFDRSPGEKTLTSISITQPGHQQGFSLGNGLTGDRIDLQFRFIPNKPGKKLDDIKGDKSVSMPWTDQTTHPIYHWQSRTLLTQEFSRQCVLALRKSDVFEWTGDDATIDSRGIPSSIVASQLSSAVLKLEFDMPDSDSTPVLEPALDRSVEPPRPGIRILYVHKPPADDSKSPIDVPGGMENEKPKNSGPLPPTRLPLGPRAPPAKVPYTPLASQGLSTAAMAQNTIQKVSFHETKPWDRPFIMNCYNLMNRGHKDTTPLTINGSRPTDLLVEIKDVNIGSSGAIWIAKELEVVIPVSFASGHVPAGVNASLPTLLTIDGTLTDPHLPLIEPLNRGSCWLYDTRLALGALLQTNWRDWMGEPYISSYTNRPEQTDLQVMLVVRMRTRLDPARWANEGNGREADGTFLLNGARLAALKEGEKEKKVDFYLYVTHHRYSNRDGAQVTTLTAIA